MNPYRWLGLLALSSLTPFANAATPTPPEVAEYRIDGAAPQPLPRVATRSLDAIYAEGDFVADASTAALSVGPHYLEVRVRAANGTWSAWQGQWFRVAGETHLRAAESFIDNDPGPGQGTPVPLPADGAWDQALEDWVTTVSDTVALSLGRHWLYVRAQDSNGDWGPVSSAAFYVIPPLALAGAAWTENALDPTGPGRPMAPVDRAWDEPEEEARGSTNTLALSDDYCATHVLHARVQDSLGRWSTRRGWYLDAARTNWLFNPQIGWAGATALLEIAPDTPAEPAPGDVNLVAVSQKPLRLEWDECQGVSGYEVYGRKGLTAAWERWAAGLTQPLLELPGFEPGSYFWMVRALGGSQCHRDSPVWQFTLNRLDAGTDADADGLPDPWEREHFGSLAPANGTSDRDEDGWLDWQESVAGTDPTNADDHAGALRIRPVAKGVAVEWDTVPNRVYTLYYATDLEPFETEWSLFDRLTASGTQLSVTNRWLDPRGAYRLEISNP